MKSKKPRAAIYARVSKDEPGSESIATQVRQCKEFAKTAGLEVVLVFDKDSDVSGGIPPRKRKDGARLYAARDKREIDAVIISEPDRLYRSDMLASELREWEQSGVAVVFVGKEIDMAGDDNWQLNAGVRGVFGQHYRHVISKKTHAALVSRALRKSWVGGKPFGYDNDVDPKDPAPDRKDKRKILVPNKDRKVVARIFAMWNDFKSTTTIARELNDKGVASPGSRWEKRKERRCSGWTSSAVRVILLNELYTGKVRWNQSQWNLNEKSGTYKRKERPPEQWSRFTYQEEAYRLIPDAVFAAAQKRFKTNANPDVRLKAGGKAAFRLSGLLKCNECGRNYVMDSGTHYACASAKDGACSNRIRVRRDVVEHHVLGIIDKLLLDPAMVREMALEIQREFNRRQKAARATSASGELKELDARIVRLRKRLRDGDPDMAADEIQLAIDRAELKRTELAAPAAGQDMDNIVTLLPRAADAYRRAVAGGLTKNPEAVAQARATLRLLTGGEVKLVPMKGKDGPYLEARFLLQRIALFNQSDSTRRVSGSGGRI